MSTNSGPQNTFWVCEKYILIVSALYRSLIFWTDFLQIWYEYSCMQSRGQGRWPKERNNIYPRFGGVPLQSFVFLFWCLLKSKKLSLPLASGSVIFQIDCWCRVKEGLALSTLSAGDDGTYERKRSLRIRTYFRHLVIHS